MKNLISIRKFLINIILYGLSIVSLLAQQSAQVSIPISLHDNAGGNKTLYFGLDQSASDSLDPHLGESDLPPLPPNGAFDARFYLPDNNFIGTLSSWNDYRFAHSFPFSGIKEHRLKYQSAQGASEFYFSWNFPPEVTGLLQDVITGTMVNVQLSGSGTYTLTNFILYNQLKLFINYNNIVTGLAVDRSLPSKFNLGQNYPNPFNPSTIIKYYIPEIIFVDLSVYNLLGEKVVTLVNETVERGVYQTEFKGSGLPSSFYIAILRTNEFSESIKMILSK